MIAPHFSLSALTKEANSSGEALVRTSTPVLAKRSTVSGRFMARTASVNSLLTMSRGVPERTDSPSQVFASNPGKPDSSSVAISGATSSRFFSPTAMARSLPALILGIAWVALSNATNTCPARRSVAAVALPL